MVCIYCGSETAVSNSRLQKRLNNVWRRRTCQQCHATFTTTERPELQQSLLVKTTSGALRPFNRDKLFISIYTSLGHRKDPTSDATAITSTITALTLKTAKNAVIEASQLSATAQQTLSRFDSVAGVHYAAYHPTKK
ncbi:MAG: hypothetical protein WAS36_00460 [Candidatus Saccharimonadales bacterium]